MQSSLKINLKPTLLPSLRKTTRFKDDVDGDSAYVTLPDQTSEASAVVSPPVYS